MAIRIISFSIIFLLTINVSVSESGDKPLVQLNSGLIEGKISTDENGNKFYSFLGIPYAEPPIGNLRFRAPVPKAPWDNVLDCTSDGPWCPQIEFIMENKYVGKEDNCLMLNVYTPKIPKKGETEKLHVLLHIHGGGFVSGFGGSSFYNPGRLMQKEKNVIIVSINYRVSVLGFLSTEDSVSPGNYGLLDQVEALRWVRNNIDRFGGDPTKVTLFGESAGGASIVYLLQSPLTKGLFQRAISMSGTSVNPWASQQSPLYWARNIASKVNCPTKDTNQLLNCLRKKTAQELTENDLTQMGQFYFTPTVDHHFIHNDPVVLLKQKEFNRVPVMIGVMREEGLVWFKMSRPSSDDFTEKELDGLLGSVFSTVVHKEKLLQLLKKKFFSNFNSMNGEQVHEILAQYGTDSLFHSGHYETVKWLAAAGIETYVYSFDYAPENSGLLKSLQIPNATGACHGCDLTFLFNGLFAPDPLTGNDLEIQKKFQKLLIDFATTGSPKKENDNLVWPSTKQGEINVYHINKDDTVEVHDESHYEHKYKFWLEDVRNLIAETSWKKDEL